MNAPNGPFEASTQPVDAVELGRFLGAWGIKGWIYVQPHSADTRALFESTHWNLLPPEARFARGFSAFSGPVLARVAEVKVHSDSIVARLEGVNDRSGAEALKGARIHVPRSAFPPAQEGEFYWVDLIGLDVVNREGVHLGVVRDLMATGPHAVLVLEHSQVLSGLETISERLIPFVGAYIDEVDLKARRIMADWGEDY